VTPPASPPAFGPSQAARHTPINEARLRDRLKMPRPEHRSKLLAFTGLSAWPRVGLDRLDADMARAARRTIPRPRSP
jgi:hypothetical protein